MDPLEDPFREQLAVFPPVKEFALAPDEYAAHVNRTKQAVKIPVIGSLNGTSPESWLTFSRAIEQAGADALELNLYEVAIDLDVSGAALEHQFCEIVAELNDYRLKGGRLRARLKVAPRGLGPAPAAVVHRARCARLLVPRARLFARSTEQNPLKLTG